MRNRRLISLLLLAALLASASACGARTYLTAYAFGWGANLRSAVGSKISSGDADLASTIAAQKTTIEAEIKKSMETYSAK